MAEGRKVLLLLIVEKKRMLCSECPYPILDVVLMKIPTMPEVTKNMAEIQVRARNSSRIPV